MNRSVDICRAFTAPTRAVPPSAYEVAASKPATVNTAVRPCYSYMELQLTSIIGPGDPFNRIPHVNWDVDNGVLLETWGGFGPNDLLNLRFTGGAPVENKTRWDHITFWLSKSTNASETVIWDVTLRGRRIGYSWSRINCGQPAARVGRTGDAGPIMSNPGENLVYDFYGVYVPSAASLDLNAYAVGVTTEFGELPEHTGVVVPVLRVLDNQEIG